MCKQQEDIWRQRSGNSQTMEKKEAGIINCSEMRTEGTSRPSAACSPPCCLLTADGSKKIESLQSVPALDFSFMTYLFC